VHGNDRFSHIAGNAEKVGKVTSQGREKDRRTTSKVNDTPGIENGSSLSLSEESEEINRGPY